MAIPNVNLSAGSGIPSTGTILAIGNNGSPLVYNPIGNQAKITFNPKVDTADTTNQGSQWDQSIPTLYVGGEPSVEIFYDPSTPGQDNSTGLVGHGAVSAGAFMQIFYNQLGGTVTNPPRPYKLTWPDGSGVYFSAWIMDANVTSDPTGKALKLEAKLKITGQVIPFGTY